MKNGWQTKKLGDLCGIELGKTPARADKTLWDERRESSNVWLSIADLLNAEDNLVVDSKEYLSKKGAAISKKVRKGTLLVSFKLTLGRLAFAGRDLFTNEAVAALTIFNERDLLKKFLFYFLHFFDWRKAAESDVKIKGMTLNKAKLKKLPVHFPSLAEQRRVVGFLDKAFEGIAAAKANAEKNLRNARAQFENHLQAVFTRHGKGWVEQRLGDIGKTQYGLSEAMNEEGRGFKIFRMGELQDGQLIDTGRMKFADIDRAEFKKYKLRPGDVLFNRTNSFELVGKTGIFNLSGDYCFASYLVRVLLNTKIMLPEFLNYFMNSERFQDSVKQKASKSINQANINATILSKEMVRFPESLNEQQTIVTRLNSLREETQRLQSIYQRKLAALDELKKSLLHRAFTGQLMANKSFQDTPTIVPFPATIPNISTTDLHAGILAMACLLHEKHGKREVFTHVKGEKIAHMVEARLGIDLGRNPVKDAAGPNDFRHLRNIESRAKKANFFEFKQTSSGTYQMKKLRGYERLVDKTRRALGNQVAEVDRLLLWMLPMNVRQAEIVATVFAAWNNLLLDGKIPTDEEIVFESRENWRPEKLKIDRKKFFAAVQWLREQNVVPEGKGRRVGEKGK